MHAGDSLLVGVVGGLLLYDRGVPIPECMIYGLGSLAGILLSPDLDQDGLTKSETLILKRSSILGWIWFLFWFPYAKLIKHRSWVSHGPIVGTLIRLAYLAPLWYILFYRLGLQIPLWAPWFVGGLGVSDIMHFLRDGLLLKGARKRGRHVRGKSFLSGERGGDPALSGAPMGDK